MAPKMVTSQPPQNCFSTVFSLGITEEKWAEMYKDGILNDYAEVYRLVYFGGIVNDDIRRELWPYLLGHYKFGSTAEQRNELGEETKQA